MNLSDLLAFQEVTEPRLCECGKLAPEAIIAEKFYCGECALEKAVNALKAVKNALTAVQTPFGSA